MTTRAGSTGTGGRMTLDLAEFPSPIGKIMLTTRDGALCSMEFRERWPHRHAVLTQRFGALELRPRDSAGVCGRLAAYFAGDLHALDALPLDAGGAPVPAPGRGRPPPRPPRPAHPR